MKSKGHALVEFVLCLEMGMLLLFGTAMLRHRFRARATVLMLVSSGSGLAAHPEMSPEERSRILTEAGRKLFPCPYCRIEIKSDRYLDQPAARFYDFIQTKASLRLGHEPLRKILSLPSVITETGAVIREPHHGDF